MLPLDPCRSGRPLSHGGGVPDVYSGLLSQYQRVHGRSLSPAFAAAVASVRLHFAFPETPVTSESCSNLAESANQANSEILQKFQANRASPPLASTGTAIGVIPTHDCVFPERARPLVTAGPGVSPFATTQLATDMSPAAQQGSTEALSNFERDPCVTVPLSTCTAPRKIPTP